jgi:hypothetical protein
MSDLELRLLEMWTADAAEWRRRMHYYEHQVADDLDIGSAGIIKNKARDIVVPKEQKTFAKTCPQCGREFKARNAIKKYCSQLCYKRATNELARKNEREERIAAGLPVRPLRLRGYWKAFETPDSFK